LYVTYPLTTMDSWVFHVFKSEQLIYILASIFIHLLHIQSFYRYREILSSVDTITSKLPQHNHEICNFKSSVQQNEKQKIPHSRSSFKI
jgi:hypothetical protein